MGLLSLFLVGLGLAVDSFAVSVCTGVVTKTVMVKNALKVGLVLGLVQGIAPLIGGLIGLSLKDLIQSVDHWVAFVLLAIVGGKMIFDGIKQKPNVPRGNLLLLKNLLIMGVATSIDATVVGIGFGLIGVNLWLAGLIVGLTTFVIASIGVLLGAHFSRLTKLRLEIIAGLVLIGIGARILVEHLVNGV